jgi:hypothetical protein
MFAGSSSSSTRRQGRPGANSAQLRTPALPAPQGAAIGLSGARRPLRAAAVWAAAAILAALCGCRSARDSTPADSAADPRRVARTQVERGPVRLVVEVAPKLARLSDEPTLTVTIDCEQGVQVDKLPFGESLGDFIIRDFRERLPEFKEQREIRRQVYTLEPIRAGKLVIQPITVHFTDNRPAGDGRRHGIESEPLAIEVASVLDEKAPSFDSLAGLEGPVELPQGASPSLWLLAAAGPLALLAAAVAFRLIRRRRKPAQETVRTPQELAYLELQQLLEQGWQQRDIKLFYVELTGIVRRYIERTTGVHAPEQTTEEFLHEVGQGDVFAVDERERLRAFLESADLVKFAAQMPEADDVERTFRRAKVFIGLEGWEAAA